MKATKFQIPILIDSVDENGHPFPNVDVKYGPYSSIESAKEILADYLVKGLTIAIIENGTIVEYWIENDTLEFVKKDIQSDWNETDKNSLAYIKNKPNIPTVNDGELTLTVGTKTTKFKANQSNNATFSVKASDLEAANENFGVVKTTSSVTNTAGYTPCPIIEGVPYYSSNIQILTDNDFNYLDNGFCNININDNTYFIYNGESKKYIYNADLTKIQICIPNVIYFYKNNKLNRLGELLDYIEYLTAYSSGVLDCLYKLTYTSNSGSILNTIKNIEALKNGDVINYIVRCTLANDETLTIPSEITATIDIEIDREKTINLINLCDTNSLTVKYNDRIFIEFLYLNNDLYITKILKYTS